jgi:hypothetical protein
MLSGTVSLETITADLASQASKTYASIGGYSWTFKKGPSGQPVLVDPKTPPVSQAGTFNTKFDVIAASAPKKW